MAKKKAAAVSSTSSQETSSDDVTERNEELGTEAGDTSEAVVSPIAGKPAPPEWVVKGYPFQNEPPTDFSRDEMREAMEQALAELLRPAPDRAETRKAVITAAWCAVPGW